MRILTKAKRATIHFKALLHQHDIPRGSELRAGKSDLNSPLFSPICCHLNCQCKGTAFLLTRPPPKLQFCRKASNKPSLTSYSVFLLETLQVWLCKHHSSMRSQHQSKLKGFRKEVQLFVWFCWIFCCCFGLVSGFFYNVRMTLLERLCFTCVLETPTPSYISFG